MRCCCRHTTGIKHFNVERTSTTFYLKDIQFTTLDQLVRYYGHADVPNKELIRGVRLLHPITRAAPYLSMFDDDERASTASPDVYIHPVRSHFHLSSLLPITSPVFSLCRDLILYQAYFLSFSNDQSINP